MPGFAYRCVKNATRWMPGFLRLYVNAIRGHDLAERARTEGATMPNAQKKAIVGDLTDIISTTKGAILTDYRGLTVAELTTLRRRLREHNAEYHIVKNTLFKIAIGGEIESNLETLLKGPTAIVFAKSDVVAPTKTILDFLKEIKKPEITVKGGWIDGKVYDVAQVTALSKLPSKDQLIGQLIGTLNAPAAEFVGTLNNIIGEFVRTIQAIHDQKAVEVAA